MTATAGEYHLLLAGVAARLDAASLPGGPALRLMPTDPPDERDEPRAIDVLPVSSSENFGGGAPHSPASTFLVAIEVRENRRDGLPFLIATVDAIKNGLLRDPDFLAAYGPCAGVDTEYGLDEVGAKAWRGARLVFTFQRRTDYPPILADDLLQVGVRDAGADQDSALINVPQ